MEQPIYKRVVLKITGEAFSDKENPFSENAANKLIDEIESVYNMGVQMAIVNGGGNIVRGRNLKIKRTTADYMGMLGTVLNALFLQEKLEERGIKAHTQTSIQMPFTGRSNTREAIDHLDKNTVLILACGTGLPFCSTDYAAMLRSYELNADALLKCTKVDGLYTHDPFGPEKEKAVLIPEMSYEEVIKANFKNIMDNSAFGLVQDNQKRIPIHIFNIFKQGNLNDLLSGKPVGSKIF